MIDIKTLLIASVMSRAAFLFVFLIASIKSDARIAFRYWTGSVLGSAAGLFLVYSDANYPYFLPLRGAFIYTLIGFSLTCVIAGGCAFFGKEFNKVDIVIRGVVPGLVYGAGRELGIRPDAIIMITMVFLIFLLMAGSRVFFVRTGRRYLLNQVIVGSSLAVYAVILAVSASMIFIRLIFPESIPDPFRSAIYMALFIDQSMSTIVYIGLVAMSLEKSQARVSELATIDPLTGLANRRGLLERASALIHACRRTRHPMAVLIVDLDHFKSINDRFGHGGGDLVLKDFAARFAAHCARGQDVICRWGGEEFVAVLGDIALTDAVALAQRLCHIVSAEPFDLCGQQITVTVSIGVAGLNGQSCDLEEALKAADAALYQAKAGGRNRVHSTLNGAMD